MVFIRGSKYEYRTHTSGEKRAAPLKSDIINIGPELKCHLWVGGCVHTERISMTHFFRGIVVSGQTVFRKKKFLLKFL